MTLYEKIVKVCSHGHHAVVVSSSGRYLIVSPFKDNNGDYRESGWRDSLEEAKKQIGFYSGFSKEFCKEKGSEGAKFHSVLSLPLPKPYKKGDLVDVLEITKDIPDFEDWYKEVQEMVGQKGLEIEDGIDDFTYFVFTKNKSKSFCFPHSVLAPHIPEEEEEEEEMKKKKEKGILEKAEQILEDSERLVREAEIANAKIQALAWVVKTLTEGYNEN